MMFDIAGRKYKMRWLNWILAIALVSAAAGCGDTLTEGGTTATSAATVSLIASAPQIGSAPASETTLTAIVKDASNRALADEAVSFVASSGSLTITEPFTDSAGRAVATLTPGANAANRNVTVTATAGTVSASYVVAVGGTTVSVAGNTSAVLADSSQLTVTVRDSAGTGVSGAVVTLSSVNGNTLAPSVVTTNATGVATTILTATAGGADTITASALGASGTHSINISADTFTVAMAATVNINICAPVTATWLSGGSPVNGGTVDFQATRGTLHTDAGCTVPGSQVLTNGAGVATIYILSPNAGPTTVTATGSSVDSPSASATSEFLATTPDSLTFQASRTTLGLNDSVTLTATVRDATGNLVKNAVVDFNIETGDTTSGSLSPASGVTDSLGRASTVYSSTVVPSATDGVQIRATVRATAITQTVALTVGGSSLFISLGMATRIEDLNTATYRYAGAVQVADAGGNPVSGITVVLRLEAESYDKGSRSTVGTTDNVALSSVTPLSSTFDVFVANGTLSCASEDLNRDGVLDLNEDDGVGDDGDGALDPGAPATITGSITTDANGNGAFDVIYPKDYADWTQVKVTATAQVSGTESVKAIRFILPMSQGDATSPPGSTSPFGTANSCTNPG
jgi:protocatechuate 3,4-dioxygenase beta subunit